MERHITTDDKLHISDEDFRWIIDKALRYIGPEDIAERFGEGAETATWLHQARKRATDAVLRDIAPSRFL